MIPILMDIRWSKETRECISSFSKVENVSALINNRVEINEIGNIVRGLLKQMEYTISLINGSMRIER